MDGFINCRTFFLGEPPEFSSKKNFSKKKRGKSFRGHKGQKIFGIWRETNEKNKGNQFRAFPHQRFFGGALLGKASLSKKFLGEFRTDNSKGDFYWYWAFQNFAIIFRDQNFFFFRPHFFNFNLKKQNIWHDLVSKNSGPSFLFLHGKKWPF